MTDDLKERLGRTERKRVRYGGPNKETDFANIPINPDGLAALAYIEQLERERDALREAGQALVEATDQMIEDTTPIFAMHQNRMGPYSGKQIGPELEAFRQTLKDTTP